MRPHLSEVLQALGVCAFADMWANYYGRRWEQALDECPDPAWLAWLAARLCILGFFPSEPLPLCAAAYARYGIPHIPEDDGVANRALDVVERWGVGDATRDEVLAMRSALWNAHANSRTPYYYNAYSAVDGVIQVLDRGPPVATWDKEARRRHSRLAGIVDSACYGVTRPDGEPHSSIARRILGPPLLVGLQAYADSLKEKV